MLRNEYVNQLRTLVTSLNTITEENASYFVEVDSNSVIVWKRDLSKECNNDISCDEKLFELLEYDKERGDNLFTVYSSCNIKEHNIKELDVKTKIKQMVELSLDYSSTPKDEREKKYIVKSKKFNMYFYKSGSKKIGVYFSSVGCPKITKEIPKEELIFSEKEVRQLATVIALNDSVSVWEVEFKDGYIHSTNEVTEEFIVR